MAQKEVGNLRTRLSWEGEGAQKSIQGFNRDLRGLRSEMNETRSRGQAYSKSLEGMKRQQDILNRTVKTQQERVRELKRRYDEARRTKGENAKQTQNLSKQYNNAQAQLNRMEGELKDVTRELERQTNPMQRLGDRMQTTGQRMKDFGRGMTDFGRGMTMRVTTPVLGVGAAALKMGMDFQTGISEVQAISGATGDELKQLEDQAKTLGSETRFSATQAADGMSFLARAGFEVNEITAAMPGLLDLAASSNMDLGRAADIASNILQGFGMEAKEAGRVSDVLAKGAATANTNVEQLGGAMQYAAPVASTLGLNIEEMVAAVGFMSDAGIQGQQAGRQLRQGFLRLANPTGKAAKLIEELGINVFDAEGNMKSVPTVIDTLNTSLSDMDSESRTAALSVLFGAESVAGWSAVLDRGGDDLAEYTTELENSEGAASDMADTMQDNAKGAMTEFKSAAEGAGIALAEHMIPTVTDLVEKGTELIRKFGELDDEQQEQIIKWGLVAAAIGPASMAIGGVTRVAGGTLGMLGRVTSAIGKKSDATGAGGKGSLIGGLGALSLSSGPMALAIAGVAGLTAGGIALHNHMKKDVIPEIDLFGDSVSNSTKKAVSSFMDLNNEATSQLNELAWSGREVSEEMAESLTGTFDEMGQQIIDGLNQRKDESLSAIQEMFDEAKNISDEEQAEILKSATESFEERINLEEEAQERINEIFTTAAEENRSTTEEENKELARLRQERMDNAIEVLSETEQEQQVIMERMKDQAADITARQMADTIKKSIDTKEGVIAEAENQYYLKKTTYENMRDELEEIEKGLTDQLIKDAERQKDETIKNAEDMHQNVIDEAKEQNPKLLEQINITTGDILSKWEQLALDSSISFAKIAGKASTYMGEIKETFDEKITIPSPVLDSIPLLREARSIFSSVKSIFSRKISMPAPRARTPNLQHKSYAEGTDYHPGGQALAGEEGPELARHGNRWSMLDFGLYDLPRGTQVFTHDESKKILNSLNNIPGYATGISPTGEANRVVNQLNNQPTENAQTINLLNRIAIAIEAGQSIQIEGKEVMRATVKHFDEGLNNVGDRRQAAWGG